MRNLLHILIMSAMIFAAAALRAEKDNSSAAFTDFKLPQYDEKGKLMFILYGKSGFAAGININLENVLVDLIRRDIRDIDSVKDFSRLTLYPITSTRAQVLEFWKDKPHCDALIWSPSAVFDRAANLIKGNDQVMFRTRFIDIDAIGFDGDAQTKNIHLRKNVRVVVRTDLVPRSGKSNAGGAATQAKTPATGRQSQPNGKQP